MDEPMDFAAWIEVYLDGTWFTFDPRNNEAAQGPGAHRPWPRRARRGDGDHVRRARCSSGWRSGPTRWTAPPSCRASRAVTDWFARPLLDLGSVDLDERATVSSTCCGSASGTTTTVRRSTCASASSPCPASRHGSLHRRAHHVDGHRARTRRRLVRRRRVDRRGNLVVDVHVTAVRSAVEFTVAAVVHRDGPLGDTALPATLAARSGPPPTHRADRGRRRAAGGGRASCARSTRRRRGVRRAGLRAWCKAGIDYGFGATSVETTAAEAWAIGRGVCQDSAHVLLALCRAAGVPARYVSGHLLGEQGGSHAWVEVLVPDGAAARALGVDPSNGCRAGPRHLPVAVGRDYADVAPTSGSYHGGRQRPADVDEARRCHRRRRGALRQHRPLIWAGSPPEDPGTGRDSSPESTTALGSDPAQMPRPQRAARNSARCGSAGAVVHQTAVRSADLDVLAVRNAAGVRSHDRIVPA